MGAQLRVYRRRIRSVQSTKKITRAMELIAASRIVKAQQRVAASTPYARELTRAVTAVASLSNVNHVLTIEKPNPTRAAMLVVTSDRGLAGAYNANVQRAARELAGLLRNEGKEVVRYAIGRKAIAYYRFRGLATTAAWSGFSEQPQYANAKDVADTLISAFCRETQPTDGSEPDVD
ncbi:MAG TPA: F0F1 ATP synthase subunit gamma, partial [Candidatus Limnocylindrales bacterium]|nr:F0F1 ATP synthase subunit gamma [Candidatus Limnocylindrales bacterium]